MSALKIGYARVSTDAQDLTAQRDALRALGVEPERIYVDHGLTGTHRDRSGLRQALAACRAGDTLVVTKLDRLARSLPDARAIVDELTAREVKLALGTSVHDPTDPVGRLLPRDPRFHARHDAAEVQSSTISPTRSHRPPRAAVGVLTPRGVDVILIGTSRPAYRPVSARRRKGSMSLDPLAVEMMDFAGRLAEARTLDDIERCYLRGVRRLIPLPAAGLCLLEPGTDKAWRRATVGVSEFFLSRYEKLGRAHDPVFTEVLRTHRPASSRALMSEARWRALPAYEEMHRLHRMTLCIQAPVLAGSTLIGTLNLGGSDDTPLPDEDRMALLGPLGRLVGAAVQSTLARGEEERRHERALAALSLSDEAVVISDVSTGERTVNEAAERLLDRVHERSSDCLDRLISSGESTPPAVRTERVVLGDRTTATLRARVAILKRSPDIIVCFLQLVDPNVGVTGNGIDHWLTERERAVAQRVARGMRDSDIADELHLSQHTVRDHVKSIYRKTGATNRVALTRMVLLGEGSNGRARAVE